MSVRISVVSIHMFCSVWRVVSFRVMSVEYSLLFSESVNHPYLLLWLSHTLDPISALDGVSFQVQWPCTSMQLEKQSTGITKRRSKLIPPPKRCRRRPTVLTDRRIASSMRMGRRGRRVGHLPRFSPLLESMAVPVGAASPRTIIRNMTPIRNGRTNHH